ncbi:MAG: nicotinamide riboside transporter PnuC [Saprospiraceae bacterium]
MFDYFQWGALISGILYVVLAARQSVWCWLWGAISTVLSGISFYQSKLYSDTLLQIYYLAAACYGYWTWSRKSPAGNMLKVQSFRLQNHLLLIALALGISFLLGRFWQQFGASLPYVDAFLAALSIIATWMTTRKILENWLYWILIDLAYVAMYFHKELFIFVILYAVYAGIAIHGFLKWRGSKNLA